jgi:hypothetical protein
LDAGTPDSSLSRGLAWADNDDDDQVGCADLMEFPPLSPKAALTENEFLCKNEVDKPIVCGMVLPKPDSSPPSLASNVVAGVPLGGVNEPSGSAAIEAQVKDMAGAIDALYEAVFHELHIFRSRLDKLEASCSNEDVALNVGSALAKELSSEFQV